jgi:hypothetical protein
MIFPIAGNIDQYQPDQGLEYGPYKETSLLPGPKAGDDVFYGKQGRGILPDISIFKIMTEDDVIQDNCYRNQGKNMNHEKATGV